MKFREVGGPCKGEVVIDVSVAGEGGYDEDRDFGVGAVGIGLGRGTDMRAMNATRVVIGNRSTGDEKGDVSLDKMR